MQEYKITTKLLEILFSRKFHQNGKGKTPPGSRGVKYAFFYKKLYEKIVNKQPIELTIGFGYHKNLNACGRPEPDKAEQKSLEFLVGMAKKIEEIYSEGVMITIFTTGERAIIANSANLSDTLAYYDGLKKMIKEDNEFSKYFKLLRLGEIWDTVGEDFYELLYLRAAEIRQKIDNEPAKYEQLCLQSARNQKNGCIAEEDSIRNSVAIFLASFEAERELDLFEKFSPGSIMLSYRLIPYYKHPTLIPWTIRKGNITQPWQGPYDEISGQVMTQTRQIVWQNELVKVSSTV